MKGNTIIITGASRGIGKAFVNQLLKEGNRIIAIARSKEGLDKLLTEFPSIEIIPCDLSIPSERIELVKIIKARFSHANILINNAGIQVNQYDHRFADPQTSLEAIKTEIEINYTAPIELSHALIPLLMENKNPSIINISSALGFVPKKSAPNYCGTKAGIHLFTKALRYQYEQSPLKVFEIIPSLIETDMTTGRGKDKVSPKALVDQFVKAYSKNQYEINIGKTGVLRFLQRLMPNKADSILKNN